MNYQAHETQGALGRELPIILCHTFERRQIRAASLVYCTLDKAAAIKDLKSGLTRREQTSIDEKLLGFTTRVGHHGSENLSNLIFVLVFMISVKA